MLRASDVDRTIVCPGTLTNGPTTGRCPARTDLQGVIVGKVSARGCRRLHRRKPGNR